MKKTYPTTEDDKLPTSTCCFDTFTRTCSFILVSKQTEAVAADHKTALSHRNPKAKSSSDLVKHFVDSIINLHQHLF